MVTDAVTPVDQGELLDQARGGDEQAFTRLLGPHRRALHVHCYRLLGSLHDADDALQETALKAWRNIGSFEPRGSLRAWLYRIATNVCLRSLERRARQPETLDPDELAALSHLQPYPDRLLESEVEERESIGLAFVTVMQLLPPRQRAVLVLRDVLGWSAGEVADLLGGSVASINSALQRGREKLERERAAGRLVRDHVPASRDTEARVVERFLTAWEAADVDAIVDLLADDAVMTMPPEALRVVGGSEIGDFFRTVPAAGALDKIVLRPTRTNGQPALAAYLESDTDELEPYGVMVLALDGESIASITGFAGQPELFPQLGLPATAKR